MKLTALRTEGVGLACCHGNDMTDGYVLKALRSRTKSLSLDNSQLQVLSPTIGRLEFLVCVSAKNNQLQTLPTETALLKLVSTARYSAFQAMDQIFYLVLNSLPTSIWVATS